MTHEEFLQIVTQYGHESEEAIMAGKLLEKDYVHCPTYDLDCPYCLPNGRCIIDNPVEECDDFAYNYTLSEEF